MKAAVDRQLAQVTQQLDQAKIVVSELEGVQDHCFELEGEVAEVRGQLNQKDTQICQLELVSVSV